MANSIVTKYRQALAAQGVVDPRSDDEITVQLGQIAEQSNRSIFDQQPEFAADYRDIREANAPSLAGEAGRALKAGTQELAATGLGLGALVTGSDYLKEKARSFQEDAAANAPTIPTIEDIAPGASPVGKVFSKDALRYGVSKLAGSVPSLAEGVGLAAGGAAIGSAVGPEGTIAGAAEGALEGFLGRGIVKSAIKRLLAKGVVQEASEAAVADAIRAGSPELLSLVQKEAAGIAARRAGTAANALNMYGMNAGALYNETGDRELAAVGGAVGAIPAVALPEIVIHKLYPGVAKEVGKQLGTQYVTRLATEALKDAGVMGGAMALQETSNAIAKNIAAGREATDISDDDWKRIKEAAIGGALTGPLVSPLTARTNVDTFNPAAAEARAAAARNAAAEPARPVATPEVVSAPIAVEQPTVATPARRVALMADAEKATRLAELTQREAALTPDEQQELTLLRAIVGEQAPGVEPVTQQPVPAIEGAPSEEVAKAVRIEASDHPEVAASAPDLLPEIVKDELALDPNAYKGESDPLSASTGERPSGESAPGATPAEATHENAPNFLPPARETELPISPEPGRVVEQGVENRATGDIVASQAPDVTTAQPVNASPPTIPESRTLEQRLRDELSKPPPFAFGKVDEASGVTLDLHDDPRFDALTPEMAKRLPVKDAMDETGNRAKTRVAAVLEAPDGHYVKAGLLVPQEMSVVGAAGERDSGPAVQSMGKIVGKGEAAQKTLKEGGNKPALLADVIAAGYKLRAIVHFDEAPGSIFQRFDSRSAYDAAYRSTEKSTGSAAAKMIPTLSASDGVERRNILAKRDELQTKIDTLGKELAGADPARAAEINDEIRQHYAELSALPEPRMMTANPESELAIQSNRTSQFVTAAARIKQAGAKVDLFTRGFLQASVRDELSKRIDTLSERYMAAKPDDQPAIQAQIERLQEQLTAADSVRGVAYSPWHMAIGMDDVQNANVADLVALLHEGGHALLGQDPVMQDRVIRAVNATFTDLGKELGELQKKSGVRETRTSDPEELIVSKMAQQLTAEGVPDAPSLARAVVQWVKDLYYRIAMGIQSAFGREPDPQMALDWFENQMRRVVGGDYDYRFASLTDRFQPEVPSQEIVRHERAGGTPGDVSDFYDSIAGKLKQPQVLPDTREGIAWNLKFMTEDDAGKELDIPAPEARARIMGAAINEAGDVAKKLYQEISASGVKIKPDEFWALVGQGDEPSLRLADLEQKVPGSGTAAIGGDRMTDPMNQQARVEAKRLIYKWRDTVVSRDARKTEAGARAEEGLIDQAKKLNKTEANLRNADMHEATLRDSLKEMIRSMAKGVKRGLDTAFAAGELAQAVREAEGLSEREAIPEEYQRVFKAVLADQVPVFDYLDSIAKLDMPLHEMTRAEILSGIEDAAAGDPVLARLTEQRNKPLLVALVALAKKNSQQMDLIQMRAIKDPEKYLALSAQLDEIRKATPAQLREMEKKINEGKKAATFADRIKRDAIKQRAKLRRMQDTIKQVEADRELLAKARAALDAKVDEMETNGMPAPSEWRPLDGEKYMAMSQGEDGRWRSSERTLEWNPDGTAKNGNQLLSDLAANFEYLRNNAAKKGTKTYQLVERMTNELAMIDVMRKMPEIKRAWFEKFMLPSGKLIVSGGGHGAAEVERMMNRYQFLSSTKSWHSDFENPSAYWDSALKRAAKTAGMKDVKAFFENVLEPVRYLIQSEPGKEEGPILRDAVRAAKRRLTTTATPAFDEAFKDILRRDKEMGAKFAKVAEENGSYVQDDKLGELRTAVQRGWMTLPRSMNAAVVSTILRDMENAGWKMVFKDAKTGAKEVKGLDKGVAAGGRVVDAASFDALLPDMAKDEADAKTRIEVIENPEAFAKAIGGFFSPGVVQRWLEPFINKPGAESVFTHAGESIDPIDVQQAWQQSGKNVAKWIDLLGERIGLEKNVDLGDEMALSDMSLEGQWRASMLKQLDQIFLMESRVAADVNQTRGLFDATSKPPHLIMDSRDNDLLPPEHVQHAAFDPASTKNLLSTLAFHAAFGRNGEAMTRALSEIQGGLNARKQAYQSVVNGANSKAGREQLAKELGYTFKELERASNVANTVEQGIGALKAQFGFGSSAAMLNDVRGSLEGLHFIASQVTNNPKTGMLNLLQLVQRAIARKSIGAATIRDTTGASGEFAKSFFGGVLENFGLHLWRASRHAADIGASQGQAVGQVPWTVVADMGSMGRRGEDLPLPIKAMRSISAVQRKGIRLGLGEAKEFPRLNLLPVVGNPMHDLGLRAAISNGTAEARAIEGVVQAAMQHYAANPDHAADPTYRLTHSDIAAQDRTLAMDKAAFDYFRNKMVEYSIGPLEKVARDAMDRATRGEPILTKDQVLKAAMLSGNEIDLQGSINTNPAAWDTNPMLKFATPLLGWPIRQMNSVHEAMRTAEGRATALQAMKTLGILAAWSMPIGLAFTFLTDQYDDKILRKKTQLGNVEGTAAIPGVGPAIALATGDMSAKDQLTAMFQRLSRAGNIYGLGFDFASSVLAGMDPTSGQRPFSMDGRILAFSQLLNLQQALSNWYNSGFATTYANFERPLIQAIVGSGPLQAVDVLGNVLGIDNQEMRINQRTNAAQWLRAAGREAGLELRRGGGGSTAPTPMSVWTREMYLAAISGDRLDFMDAYRRAIDAAREAGADNPEQKVLESWKSRDPREVFRLKPDDAQMARMLSLMSDNGRDAVQTALRQFQQFTDMIAITPADQYEHRILAQQTRVPNIQSLRARMAAGALSFR